MATKFIEKISGSAAARQSTGMHAGIGVDADTNILYFNPDGTRVQVVDAASTQTISGDKTFTGTVVMSGAVTKTEFADGTVSLPSVTFSSDLNSGLYRIGADNIGVAVNGTKVLDIGTTGLASPAIVAPVLSGTATGTYTLGGTPTLASSAGVPYAAGVAAGYKVARGQHTTVDEDDTVVTGLATVVSVVASFEDDPVAGAAFVSAVKGDQAGAPAAGSIQIKTFESDLTAGTTFSKKVNWIAVGT